MSEIDNWGEPTDAAKQKDALIRELMDGRHRDLDKMREMKALIRELMAALGEIAGVKGQFSFPWPETHEDYPAAAVMTARAALAKAKEQGYEV